MMSRLFRNPILNRLKSSYKVAKSVVDAAKFDVISAEASLKEANENLVKTSIYAPMTGIRFNAPC